VSFAGNGSFGYSSDGALAGPSPLPLPEYLTLDSESNIIYSDRYSHVIRMINITNGVLSTIAGNLIAGYSGDDSLAVNASLRYPTCIAFDINYLYLYFVDNGNQVIRRVDMITKLISTFVNLRNEISNFSSMKSPYRKLTVISGGISLYNIVLDAELNLYVSDSENCVIFKVHHATLATTIYAGVFGVCGYAGDGLVAWDETVLLRNPLGLVYDNTTKSIIFVDNGNSRVRKINLNTGNMTTIAGNGQIGLTGDGSNALNSSLSNPVSLAVDKYGNIYVSDRNNSVIRMVDASTGIISIFIGTGTAGYNGEDLLLTTTQLNYPYGIAVDSDGNFFTADTGNNRIRFTKAILIAPTVTPSITPSLTPTITPSITPSLTPTITPSIISTPSTSNRSCSICNPGSYIGQTNVTCCTLCEVDYYSDEYDSPTCDKCQYPYTNLIEGSTACPNVFIDNQMISLYIIAGMIGFSILFGVFYSDFDTRRMFILMILPILDVVSDFLVILAVTFYNNVIFALVTFFFIFPSYYFLYYLINNKKYPRLTVLPIRKGSNLIWLSSGNKSQLDWIYPHMNDQPMLRNYIDTPIIGVVVSLCAWSCFILLQIVYLALALVLIILNVPFQIAWFVLGCLLFQTSIWSINYLWAIWLYVWCNDLSRSVVEHDVDFSISDPRLRTSILVKLYIETIFEIILQVINLFLLNTYGYSTMIGILSIIISFLNIYPFSNKFQQEHINAHFL